MSQENLPWNPSLTTLRRHFPARSGVVVNGKDYGDVIRPENQNLTPGCLRVYLRGQARVAIVHHSKLQRAL